jgi:hypothetical protein
MGERWYSHAINQPLFRFLMKAILLVFCLFLIHAIGKTQVSIAPITYSDKPYENIFFDGSHEGIQPAIRYQNIKWYPKPSNDTVAIQLIAIEYARRRNTLLPVVDGFASVDTRFNYRSAVGVSYESNYKNWTNKTLFTTGWATTTPLNQHPTVFDQDDKSSGHFYTDLRTRFGYTPNKTTHISFGIDNQFFGEGYRSLIQGDQVAPNPFALARIHFWKLEYGLLYQGFMENDSVNPWKFNTTHYLSFRASNRLSFAVFESVLFQPKDVSFKRGFEVEYLNPFVFFRPQEYSIGSTDNVFIAAQAAYRFKNKCIYTQVTIDEFDLTQIRNRTRWWANKYGIQLGIKGTKGKLMYRFEGNLVRPYTYSHVNAGQNNGHLGRPLAHLLGANFVELISVFYFPIQRYMFKTFGTFYLKGFDENGLSYGGDVYQSYVLKPADKEFNNTIGQGITIRNLQLGSEISTWIKNIDGRMYCQMGVGIFWGDIPTKMQGNIVIGVRSALFQDRKIF